MTLRSTVDTRAGWWTSLKSISYPFRVVSCLCIFRMLIDVDNGRQRGIL